ncbi:transcriptional regulator [Oceanobacillus picturae]|uniref:Transcriptional regulator n=1 Tax=Oceanobacillus picturae TaxID=171693 RepID=A0A0U9HE99_9BACI|nr:helix-turn-helix transcriptional regulator [Oceanobacillus picturae]GAQ18520.1 transcriptional regulator [Oceanobacillus picturae]
MNIDNDTFYKIRKVYRLTSHEMAEKLGYSQTYVSRIERGLENVTDNVSDKLKLVFDLDAEKLVEIKSAYYKFIN